MKKLYLLLILSLSLSCANGLDDMFDDLGMKVPICVNSAAPAGGDGRGWGRAFRTIPEALAVANSGDEIWVAGTQIISASINVTQSVSFYGGFNGTESRKEERTGSLKTLVNDTTSITSLFEIDNTNVLFDRFILTNNDGGGRALTIQNSHVTITNSDFLGNTCPASGGAIYSNNNNTDVTIIKIKDSIFKGNNAGSRGGACYFNYVDRLEITGCTFGDKDIPSNGNSASTDGGAILIQDTDAIISDSFFYNNTITTTGAYSGGAIFNYYTATGNMQINNCTFSNNTAKQYGGAIFSNYDLTIRHSTISNNTAQSGGGIYMNMPGRTCTITNCDITGNNSTLNGGGGGGICVVNGSCVITGSNIHDNEAKSTGGGIYVYYYSSSSPSLTVTGSSFTSNKTDATVGGNGGAISVGPAGNSIPLILNSCRFEANYAKEKGGAIWLNSSSTGSSIINSLFYNNSSDSDGGAVALLSSGEPKLTNLTFYYNNAVSEGGAVYLQSHNYVINNSVFFSNTHTGPVTDNVAVSGGTFTFNYSFANGGFYSGGAPIPYPPGPGGVGSTINDPSNPFFSTDSLSPGFLYPAAVIVNKGNDAAEGLSLVNTDLAGNPRKVGTVDIGAYERQ